MRVGAVQPLPIAAIEVGERLRAVDAAWVEALAASIAASGLQQPLHVIEGARPSANVNITVAEARYRLVAGAHRLAACRQLGLAEVPARIVEGTALEARLLEIDDNLFRRELGPLDRAAFLAERKAVYEALYPDTRAGVAGGKSRQGSAELMFSFAEETARRTGMGRSTVKRAVAIHSRLAPEIRARLAGTALAGREGDLYALSKMDPALQARVVDLVGSGAAATVGQARRLIEGAGALSADDAALARLLEAWRRAGPRARRQFLQVIVEQVPAAWLAPTGEDAPPDEERA